jgi:hypothetical protein
MCPGLPDGHGAWLYGEQIFTSSQSCWEHPPELRTGFRLCTLLSEKAEKMRLISLQNIRLIKMFKRVNFSLNLSIFVMDIVSLTKPFPELKKVSFIFGNRKACFPPLPIFFPVT